jgi:hypothetical protein
MAMALAARGDFLATSAAGGVVTGVTGLTAAVFTAADLADLDLVAVVTDLAAEGAGEGFLAMGGVLALALDGTAFGGTVFLVATAF